MIIKDQKFNGKIYGKAGSYHIYVNDNKIEVSDSDVSDYKKYLQEIEELKEMLSGVLHSIEVQKINISIGGEKLYIELNLEQMKAKIENFPVETVWSGVVEDHEGKITKATYQGKFVARLLEWKKNGEVVERQYLSEEDIANAILELTE